MSEDRAKSDGGLQGAFKWSEDEINRYLAMRFRSCVDLAFIRGELP